MLKIMDSPHIRNMDEKNLVLSMNFTKCCMCALPKLFYDDSGNTGLSYAKCKLVVNNFALCKAGALQFAVKTAYYRREKIL